MMDSVADYYTPEIGQVWFRAGKSTTEQIFNLRILCEKYLEHQQNLYHVFIDFTKAFVRVWHEALWAAMRKYNISANHRTALAQGYRCSPDEWQIGRMVQNTVGVRQRCLLSPTPFSILLERIMCDACSGRT